MIKGEALYNNLFSHSSRLLSFIYQINKELPANKYSAGYFPKMLVIYNKNYLTKEFLKWK